jgi:hypothetical protein
MTIKKIIVEIEVPEDFNLIWNDGSGLQAFHEAIKRPLLEYGLDTLIEICKRRESKNEIDILYANFLEVHNKVRESLKAIGVINKNNEVKYV